MLKLFSIKFSVDWYSSHYSFTSIHRWMIYQSHKLCTIVASIPKWIGVFFTGLVMNCIIKTKINIDNHWTNQFHSKMKTGSDYFRPEYLVTQIRPTACGSSTTSHGNTSSSDSRGKCDLFCCWGVPQRPPCRFRQGRLTKISDIPYSICFIFIEEFHLNSKIKC